MVQTQKLKESYQIGILKHALLRRRKYTQQSIKYSAVGVTRAIESEPSMFWYYSIREIAVEYSDATKYKNT